MTDVRAPITVDELREILGGDIAEGIKRQFTNKHANAVTHADLVVMASRLGCTLKQLQAVAKVESGGGGFDRHGRPKILYERHLFHRMTDGRWSPSTFSNKRFGGYNEDSWAKLVQAAERDPDAAFGACSWGKFQVLGMHWSQLGYPSAYSLAWTTAQSEGDHYELLARYIEAFRLVKALRALSTNPEDCRAFAKGYNGPAYARNKYHIKLAEAMR